MKPEHTEANTITAPSVGSGALLGLGLFVIETRSRNRDKRLGPWKLRAAFVWAEEADYWLQHYQQTGYARLRLPNTNLEPRRE